MSKYEHIRNALAEGYPLNNPKLVDDIMKRIKQIVQKKEAKKIVNK